MRIHETTLLCLNDPHPQTGQVKGGHGQDQDQALERFGRRELTAVELIATRFFGAYAFFDVEAQTVLAASVTASVGSSLTTIKAVIGLVKETGQGQVDRPNGGS
jgi:hypothetical protein